MTTYTLKQEIEMAGLNKDMMVGIDNKYGEVIKASITVKDLLEGRNKTLLNKKVKDVMHGTEGNEYIFILNSK